MDWETVVGLEIHVRMQTRSKLFSGASAAFGAEPNVQATTVDLGLPGTLPVPNREAVACAIRFGLAIGAPVAERSVFARKNYFYPDLPKGYQITQMDHPIVGRGTVEVARADGGGTFEVRVLRAHLEEDAGKSVHDLVEGCSAIDLNRAGLPLLEVVSEPDMRSPAEASAYARHMHALVRWIGVCDGNLQEGSFRCDANVSVRRPGAALGTRTEIKNLNSFRFLEAAIAHEVERQIDVLESGGTVVQETRLYDPDADETRPMRTKEEANDYRYFPDPDLPPLTVSAEEIEAVRASLPELPGARRARFVAELGLSETDAAALSVERAVADWFEAAVDAGAPAKPACNWLTGDIAAKLNREGLGFEAMPIDARRFAGLLARVEDDTISMKIAKRVFDAMWESGDTADAVIEREGLKQISDTGAIDALVDQVVSANPSQAAEYRAGKTKLMGFFVGAAMKASGGKANPGQLNAALAKRLEREG